MASSTLRNSELVTRNYNVPNLLRAFEILEFMAKEPQGWSVTALADRLGFPKNSVFRICRSLHAMRYLRRMQQSYFLSPKLLAVAYAGLGAQNLIEKAIDVLRDLRNVTNETTLYGILVGNEGVVLEQVVSNHPMKYVVDVGHRFPLHTSSPGKAILAFLPKDERDRIIDQLDFKKYTQNSITRRSDFLRALEQVRESGFSVDHGERLEGINCVGAPVLNFRKVPVAAVWVTGPDFRLPHSSFNKVGKIVREHAIEISHRYGFEPEL